MTMPKREIKYVLTGEEARNKILEGTRRIYEAVASTYGPAANNVLLSMPFGDPTLTRDGVTVAKRVNGPNIGFKDRAESDAAAILRQASEKTNKTAGDGTTATIVLAYYLLRLAHRQVIAGDNAMVLKKQLDRDARAVIEFIKKQSESAEKHLVEVATVSSGDPNIGKLVSSTLKDIGYEGGISIREQSFPTIDVEKVNGYYFDKGFFALNQQIEYEKPHILVSQKVLSSNADIVPILNTVVQSDNKKLVIIGEVRGDALATLINNVVRGVLDGVVIPPPMFGDESKLFMEDIATYTGAELFTNADTSENVTLNTFGSAERVQVSSERAIIFNGAGDTGTITSRAAQIRENIAKETNAHAKDQLEQRYSKLVGKIAIVNVGGSTQAEMEELRYRVEDAIEATKSAMADGVVPGGATTLLRAAQLDISKLFAQALTDTFKKLMDNAAEPSDYRLKQLLTTKPGYGFNLRDMTDEPIDLKKAGIWDATRAVVQIVENATSAAGALLTAGAIVGIEEDQAEIKPRED